ncbi:MAG: hypothetical protein ASARMPRED_002866 [Alectoria sarmentosa]|nr:MAG: hypothetical protein ASARMPRED_002866 [Alectoria sarmentosa]
MGDYQLMTENYINIASKGKYGLDTVGLGVEAANGLTSNQNVVAGVLTEPFYLGQIGLKPLNTTTVNGTASLMAELKNEKLIPKQQPILGSLTFGGYDSSRFLPTTASFPLAGNDSQSLMIGIESITATGTLASNVTLLSNDTIALIDTTLPYLWLPLEACQQFETAFGLSWDLSTEIYLVNDTIHQQLQNLNPTVTFTLGNSSASQSVNITLPYGAFDLQASNPIYPNGTNYFPLRRASNPHHPDASPHHSSDSETAAPNAPRVRELEATELPLSPREEPRRGPRQELAGSPTAKELPPVPPRKMRHLSELAGG